MLLRLQLGYLSMDNIDLPVYDPKKCFLFALGRNAIYAACRSLGVKENDEVMTPAFDCDTSLQPFRALSLKLNFIRQDADSFDLDLKDLKNKISPRTKLIHIINHFGFPQPWERLMHLRRETGIPILADNAYSLFSEFNGQPLGACGDFSIFSFRKNLPVATGGMLRINNPEFSFIQDTKKNRWFYPVDTALTLKSALKFLLPGIRGYVKPPVPLYSDRPGYPDYPERDNIQDDFACGYERLIPLSLKAQLGSFSRQDFMQISEKKKYFYALCVKELAGAKKLIILNAYLPVGVVPHCVSLLILKNRDRVLENMVKKYYVIAWPTLSKSVLEKLADHPEVESLGRRILQIVLPSDLVLKDDFAEHLKRLVKDLKALIGE